MEVVNPSDSLSQYTTSIERLPAADILQEVPYCEWPALRDVFRRDWPRAIHVYYMLQNYITWKRKDPSVPFSIYCPHGNFEDGTVVIETYANAIFVFTLQPSCARLTEALSLTRKIRWSEAPFIHAAHQAHWPRVQRTLGEIAQGETIPSSYHWITKEEAAAFEYEVPQEVYVAPLTEKDIPIMNSLWPHSYPGSDVFFRHAITLSEGLGLFRRADDSLVCWIIRNQYHGLGVLQTVDEHRRKGYGKLMVKAMSKKMGQEGIDVHTFIPLNQMISCVLKKVRHLLLQPSATLRKSVGVRNLCNTTCCDMVRENEPLEEIHAEEWPQLEKTLLKARPRGMVMYYWLKMRMQWMEKEPNANPFHVCCPEGNVGNGLVSFGKTGDKTYFITVLTFGDDLSKMTDALLRTNRIDWRDKPTCGVPPENNEWFTSIVSRLGYRVHHHVSTFFYTLPRHVALGYEISCPPDVTIAPLGQKDVATMNSNWPHRFDGSFDYLSHLVRLCFGYGVFSKKDQELLAWMTQLEFMDMAVLQTKEEHRRKGYAKMVVQTLSKKIAESGEDPYAYIVKKNVASEKLLTSLGFTKVSDYDWIEFE